MDFIHYNQARDIIDSLPISGQSQKISIVDSLGKYTSSDIFAPIDVPVFTNSAMDGYGFVDEHIQVGKRYVVVGEIKAGASHFPNIKPGEAVRIFTGAPVPPNVQTVIIQENCTSSNEFVTIEKGPVDHNMNIRTKGSQTPKDSLIVSKNTKLTPGINGFLASFGIHEIEVYKTPNVGILVTGDELVSPGQSLQEGQIYESNGVALESLLKALQIIPVFKKKVKDDEEILQKEISVALQNCDVLLMTGGISVGTYDFAQKTLFQNGVEKVFYKVRQRPGKPLFIGKTAKNIIFALPGNPASVFTCFHVYVLPFLRRFLSGGSDRMKAQKAIITHQFEKKTKLTHFLKAIEKDGKISLLTGQESYRMDAFTEANCFCIIDEEKELLLENDAVAFIKILQ